MSSTVLAWLASVVFLVRLVPQPARLARSGVAAGVSPLAALNALIVAVAWIVYGLQAALPAVWIVSVFALLPGVWTVALLRSETTTGDVAGAAAWVGVLVVAGVTGFFGVALGLGVAVTQGPQVVTAIRARDLSGVSPATWWLSIIDAAAWGAYGAAVADAALVGYGVVLATSAVIVLSRVWWTRAQVSEMATASA